MRSTRLVLCSYSGDTTRGDTILFVLSDGSSAAEPAGSASVALFPAPDPDRIRRLTARMRAGDEEAFGEFYDSYCDRLFRYLLLLTRGNEDLSRELLQDSMTKVARRPREFHEENHLWHWLATIARHGFIDALRRAQRGPELVPLPPVEPPELRAVPSPDAEAPLFDALDRCLHELDPEEQALIDGCYFRSVSHQSLAAEQQTTPKAVESKLARLRQKLRAAILRRLRYEND